jgi:hypothetical protein
MNTKFEKLNDQLFSEAIDKKQMSKIVGGLPMYNSFDPYYTYVTINSDMGWIVDDTIGGKKPIITPAEDIGPRLP